MNIMELFDSCAVPYRTAGEDHHATQGWVSTSCPYCDKAGESFHLGFNLTYGNLNCWRCGRLNTKETLCDLTGLSWGQLSKDLDLSDTTRHRAHIHRGKLKLPYGIGKLHKAHIHYLEERGFEVNSLLRLWNIKGIGIASRLSWRIYIPIHFQGEQVSWTTRTISTDDDVVRYLSAKSNEESYPHKKVLYGEEYCRNSIIVHEGPLDVWATGPGATATFGTSFTRAQASRIAAYPRRIICLDSTPDGQRAARKLCGFLKSFSGETIQVVLESGKDAASISHKEMRKLRRLLK